MIDSLPAVSPEAARPRDADAELMHQARQLEGIFLAQLYQAMRATVPTDGSVESSSGRETFTAMLDDKIAEIAVSKGESALSRALYEQLRQRITAPPEVFNTSLQDE